MGQAAVILLLFCCCICRINEMSTLYFSLKNAELLKVLVKGLLRSSQETM